MGGLRSMTGFGTAHAPHGAAQLEVEVRSVNGRHLKVATRVPEALGGLAPQLEELVRGRLARGAVHLTVRAAGALEAGGPQVDVALLKRLHGQLAAAARELGADPPRVGEVALLPGVVREDVTHDAAAELWPALERLAGEALDGLDAMRRREGEGIADDLRRTAGRIRDVAREVEALVPEVVREQGNRLRARIEQLMKDAQLALDPGELARETALLADRGDICEEVQRLRSHVEQLLGAIDQAEGPVGRKLEFLAQELLREANTMASKTHDTALVQRILAVKLDVERIREQVANVE
ncbi:MAG: YicC family protein [Planctomycetes bacterium]|nr:YicC family protein [Planctomycetota bacterium]